MKITGGNEPGLRGWQMRESRKYQIKLHIKREITENLQLDLKQRAINGPR